MAPPDDKHFQSSKPAIPTAPPPIPNGATNSNPIPIPPRHHPYRQQPYSHQQRRWQRPSNRRICCCCCFWSILILLITILIASLIAIGLYVIYHPRPPSFSVASLRIQRFNLTTSPDSSSAAHLSSLFKLTLITKNPNSHFVYNYEPFLVSVVTDPDEIFLGNGTIPAFSSGEKNMTSFRGIVVTSTETREVDFGDVSGLKSDLKRRNGLDLKILMDTKVEIRMGKLKSKRVGIRVSCTEIKGSLPKGKASATSMASTDKSKCKVDLRIKFWNWTF
ncbi:hypothetical protein EUTSA_v10002067mg [Eutrema salsugineum]|uniref:Late embryogenesis abundant protein LEA-2 subgroup domain-containing protein n=1 Tax=Eutrema salsugineum TaxID=72664 RepID=V4MCT4_EUTSA|nr:NDR1/HIN1-like protein 6 [Eutrema salsugineum]ESQ50308.1 hypothetical protein EUTSA_v10002067mg [Eutrema salsugineum]